MIHAVSLPVCVCMLCSAESGRTVSVCDNCAPAAVAVRTMAGWWASSVTTGFFSTPSPEAIKLWLQIAEQAFPLLRLEAVPKDVRALLLAIIAVIREDVLNALNGVGTLDKVPWFPTLQQCPNMAKRILFSWDEYNEWLLHATDYGHINTLPLLLSDVIQDSPSTLCMLRRLWDTGNGDHMEVVLRVVAANLGLLQLEPWTRGVVGMGLRRQSPAVRSVAVGVVKAEPDLLGCADVAAATVALFRGYAYGQFEVEHSIIIDLLDTLCLCPLNFTQVWIAGVLAELLTLHVPDVQAAVGGVLRAHPQLLEASNIVRKATGMRPLCRPILEALQLRSDLYPHASSDLVRCNRYKFPGLPVSHRLWCVACAEVRVWRACSDDFASTRRTR